jgi:hypothetical protein
LKNGHSKLKMPSKICFILFSKCSGTECILDTCMRSLKNTELEVDNYRIVTTLY